eukprot:m.1602653 g.1602653  ORF g.1602653 m.1602653 type:complete len:779 (-) comp25353_c0_seq68:6930-9266(-)
MSELVNSNSGGNLHDKQDPANSGCNVTELLKRLGPTVVGQTDDSTDKTATAFDPLQPITSPSALPGILQHAIASCSVSEKIELLSMLIVCAAHSKINREYITRYASFDKLLAMEVAADGDCSGGANVITMKVFQLVHLLGSHSISVKELRTLLTAMRTDNVQFNATRALRVLSALQAMAERQGPEVYFHFTGENSAIVLPPIKRWPYNTGFSVNLWIWMETNSAGAVNSGTEMQFRDANLMDSPSGDVQKPATTLTDRTPHIYSFCTANGQGYIAKIVNSKLELSTTDNKGNTVSVLDCTSVLHTQQWYMLTVTYQYSRLRKSTVRCYVDGRLTDSGQHKLVNTSAQFHRCCIGAAESLAAHTVFHGDMGAMYLFDKPMTPGAIAALHGLGPGYNNNFQNILDRELSPDSAGVRELQALQSALICNYNPMACEGDAVLESSPAQGLEYFVHSPHATMLSGVVSIKTEQLQQSLRSSGGIQVLLPLFSQLKDVQARTTDEALFEKEAGLLISTLLSLICALITNHTGVQEQTLQIKGFLLVGFLLEQVHPFQLDVAVVNVLLETATALSNMHGTRNNRCRTALLKSLMEDILLNHKIWERAPTDVQELLHVKLAAFLETSTTEKNHAFENSERFQSMYSARHFAQSLAHLLLEICMLPALYVAMGIVLVYPSRGTVMLLFSFVSIHLGPLERHPSLGLIAVGRLLSTVSTVCMFPVELGARSTFLLVKMLAYSAFRVTLLHAMVGSMYEPCNVMIYIVHGIERQYSGILYGMMMVHRWG